MMKTRTTVMLCMALIVATTTHAQKTSKTKLNEQEVSYKVDGVVMNGYVAYNPNLPGKLPAVLVVPEWWGCGEYVRMRARMLAELGYMAITVDMYGEGKAAKTVAEAQEMSGVLYKDPALAKARLQGAIDKIKIFSKTDGSKIAAVGYCFGGSMVLGGATAGMDLVGVVSMHGGLAGITATKGVTKGKILVCHGGADKFVSAEDVTKFKASMDAAGVKYTFKTYKDATHAFTNPEATENGKKFNLPIAYNEAADKASWEDMKTFLKSVLAAK